MIAQQGKGKVRVHTLPYTQCGSSSDGEELPVDP